MNYRPLLFLLIFTSSVHISWAQVPSKNCMDSFIAGIDHWQKEVLKTHKLRDVIETSLDRAQEMDLTKKESIQVLIIREVSSSMVSSIEEYMMRLPDRCSLQDGPEFDQSKIEKIPSVSLMIPTSIGMASLLATLSVGAYSKVVATSWFMTLIEGGTIAVAAGGASAWSGVGLLVGGAIGGGLLAWGVKEKNDTIDKITENLRKSISKSIAKLKATFRDAMKNSYLKVSNLATDLIVDLTSIAINPLTAENKSWDKLKPAPDIKVEIYNKDGKILETKTHKDVYSVDFNANMIKAKRGDYLIFKVIDVDLARDDLIEEIIFQVPGTEGMIDIVSKLYDIKDKTKEMKVYSPIKYFRIKLKAN